MKMRPGVLTDTSRVKPWPTEGEWTCFLVIPSYYSLCTFDKCLCKIGSFEQMFGWGEFSGIILFPKTVCFRILTNFLQCNLKVLRVIDVSMYFEK